MVAAAARVPMATVPWGDDKVERTTQFATSTIYYPGQMMALAAAGAADHATDTAGILFDGILAETDRVQVFAGDTAGRPVKIERPWRFAMAIAAAAAGDEGKAVYVVDNQTVGYNSTNGVFVGWVDQVISATFVLIRPFWCGGGASQAQPSTLANFRNLIDGGDMTVNPFQRGNSQAADITNTLTYGPDRFAFKGGASSAINWSKVADTTVLGFGSSLKFQRKAANADLTPLNLVQVLETADSIRCQGQPVTFSFWTRAGANYSGGVLTAKVISGTGTDDTANNMLTAAWAGQANVVNATQALNTTMTRYSFTGTVPVGCKQVGIQLTWTPTGTAGVDDSIVVNGFQLEIGGSETLFEHRDVQVELEICQRYFYQVNEPAANVIVGTGSVSASNVELFYLALPVQMRTAPTVTVSVGTFKVNSATGGLVAATGLTGNATHTVNAIGLTATGTGTAGQAAMLQGGGGAGLIAASADY